MSALTWGLVLLSYAIGAAKLQQGRCSHCQRAGVRSSVILEGATSCTAMHCGSGHYDKRGVFVPPPQCNTCTTPARCTRGHEVVVTEGGAL